MIHQLHIRKPSSYAIQYLFTNIGDGLPMHTHDAGQAHDVTVVYGSIAIYCADTETIVVKCGERLTFDWSRPHEIEALESNTVIRNEYINGMPQGYDKLLAHELNTTFESLPLKSTTIFA